MKHKPSFAQLWDDIVRSIRSIASNSVSYHDAQDLVSEFIMRVWVECEEGRHEFNDAGHARAYYVKCFKHRVVDFIRERGRYNKTMEGLAHVYARWTATGVYANCTLGELRRGAVILGGRMLTAYNLVEQGHTIAEAGALVGIPKTSIYRAFKEGLALRLPPGRVLGEGMLRQQRKGASQMANKFSMSCKNGVVSVMDGAVPVARATINDSLQVQSVVLQKKGVDREDLVDQVLAYVKSCVTLDMIPKQDDAKKESMKMPTKKEREEMKKEKAKKAAPPKPQLPKIKALDLSTLTDVPSKIKDWIEQCGGDGYCLGGSGEPVARRFKPGYDAKLKSTLKRIGNANAKALAKELGWYAMIKWDLKAKA